MLESVEDGTKLTMLIEMEMPWKILKLLEPIKRESEYFLIAHELRYANRLLREIREILITANPELSEHLFLDTQRNKLECSLTVKTIHSMSRKHYREHVEPRSRTGQELAIWDNSCWEVPEK